MDYTYRSPLEDEYNEPNDHYGRGYRPPSSRLPHSGYHRDSKPYTRPTSSKQFQPSTTHARPQPSSSDTAQTYSSRYKLSSYPKELNDMFGAMECKLCLVEVSSPIVAKMHYSGKQHMKKIKNFLAEWSLKTGNSVDNYQHLTTPSTVLASPDYCELCDVRLLSTNDKIAHCSGKQHRKNERDPSIAKKRKKAYDTIDISASDDRFGIGIDFSSDKKADIVPKLEAKNFVCELCDVKAVSRGQLEIHLTGKSHQHRLKKKESGVPKPDRPYKCDICDVALKTSQQLKLHLEGKPHEKRVRKYETEFKSDEKTAITCKNCPYVGNLENHLCDRSLENNSLKNDSDTIWECNPCYNMMFNTKEEYEEHKKTRRHLMCMMNVEGDKISEDKKHWYCFVCRKQYHSHKQYCEHLFEQKHMTLADDSCDLGNRTDLFYCSVCAIVIDQQAKDEHMKSKNHLVQAARQDITETLMVLATEELGTQSYHCTNCDTTFLSFVAYSDHLLALDHIEKLVSAKLAPKTV